MPCRSWATGPLTRSLVPSWDHSMRAQRKQKESGVGSVCVSPLDIKRKCMPSRSEKSRYLPFGEIETFATGSSEECEVSACGLSTASVNGPCELKKPPK